MTKSEDGHKVHPGNAGSLASNAGSSGVTLVVIVELEYLSRSSASRRTLAGEGTCVPGEEAPDWQRGKMGTRKKKETVLDLAASFT